MGLWINGWMGGWMNGWIERLRGKISTCYRASPLHVWVQRGGKGALSPMVSLWGLGSISLGITTQLSCQPSALLLETGWSHGS
jgi:hypothetical protein